MKTKVALSLAGLIIASTFAQATLPEEVKWTDLPTTVSGTDRGTWTISSSSADFSFQQNSAAWTIAFTIDAGSLTSQNSATVMGINETGNDNFAPLAGIKWENGGFTLKGFSDKSDAGALQSGALTGANNVTLVLERQSNTLTLKAFKDGDFTSNLYTTSPAFSNWYFSTQTINALTFGGVSRNQIGLDNNGTEFSLLGASYWTGGIAGTDALNAYYAAVPEPSMFGVLAGLGALALVGSRRRHK